MPAGRAGATSRPQLAPERVAVSDRTAAPVAVVPSKTSTSTVAASAVAAPAPSASPAVPLTAGVASTVSAPAAGAVIFGAGAVASMRSALVAELAVLPAASPWATRSV